MTGGQSPTPSPPPHEPLSARHLRRSISAGVGLSRLRPSGSCDWGATLSARGCCWMLGGSLSLGA
eukprot:15430838-Alexandrium_andersonii.AAC.1